MNNMNIDTANSNSDTFLSLCQELGKRINSMDNALLCYRAYLAYNKENPKTTQGQGNSSDRDASIPAFRNAAAKASGVAVGTIDALLQVGKAIGPLPKDVQEALSSCPLGNWTTGLRKLATSKFDKSRADIITTYAKEHEESPETALKNLKDKLGMKEKSVESQQGEASSTVARTASSPKKAPEEPKVEVEETFHQLTVGDHFETQVGPYLVRVEVSQQADGRIHLIAVHGKTEQVKAHIEKKTAVSIHPAPSSVLNGAGAIAP